MAVGDVIRRPARLDRARKLVRGQPPQPRTPPTNQPTPQKTKRKHNHLAADVPEGIDARHGGVLLLVRLDVPLPPHHRHAGRLEAQARGLGAAADGLVLFYFFLKGGWMGWMDGWVGLGRWMGWLNGWEGWMKPFFLVWVGGQGQAGGDVRRDEGMENTRPTPPPHPTPPYQQRMPLRTMSTTSKSGCVSPEASERESRPVPSSLATAAGVLCGWSFSPVCMCVCVFTCRWTFIACVGIALRRRRLSTTLEARSQNGPNTHPPEAAISFIRVSRSRESKVRSGPSKRTKRCVSTPRALKTPASSTILRGLGAWCVDWLEGGWMGKFVGCDVMDGSKLDRQMVHNT